MRGIKKHWKILNKKKFLRQCDKLMLALLSRFEKNLAEVSGKKRKTEFLCCIANAIADPLIRFWFSISYSVRLENVKFSFVIKNARRKKGKIVDIFIFVIAFSFLQLSLRFAIDLSKMSFLAEFWYILFILKTKTLCSIQR